MNFKQKNTGFIFLVFIFVFLVIYLLTSPFLQLKSYNILTKFTLNNKISNDKVVLVTIDDKSLHEIGRWPWKREYYLEIFNFFENYTDAKLIGYDALIASPDTENSKSDKKFFSNVKKYNKLTAGVAFSNNEFEKGTNKEALDKLLFSKTDDIRIIDKRSKKYQTKGSFKSFTLLEDEYFKNIKSLGSVDVILDSDGYVRQVGQLISYQENFFPSMGLSLFSKYYNMKDFIITDKYLWGFSKESALKVPIENINGMVSNYICYYKPFENGYTHKKYSASDIINSYRAIKQNKKPVINPDEFKDKVVFIGANAQAQALNDTLRTPVDENFSGLDIQATNFDNLISNNFIKKLPAIYNFLICAFIFILVFYLAGVMPIISMLLTSVLIMFSYILFAYIMYYNKIAVSLILPGLFILVSLGCTYSYRYFIEHNKKEKMQKTMGKYLSYDVMKNVVENIDNIELGGKREDISVLFADIRNFTSISEKMDAGSVTDILNEYYSTLIPVVEENNGILNKFMGDAVLVIFGSPKKSPNHALDAIKCANKMLRKVKVLQEKWLDEGKPKIEIGIGISSGEAFVGNIGSNERLEYTVIGDTVNTASRIESYNKIYRTNFLISETTYKRVENFVDAIAINDVTIRGKRNKITLYEIIRLVD